MTQNFYVLEENCFSDLRFAYGENYGKINTGDAKHCPGCGGAISKLEWLPPYDIMISSKRKLADLVFGTYQGFICSKRFLDAFFDAGLRGLSNIKKVNLYFRRKPLDAEYFYPEIIRINAFVDLSRVKCNWPKPMCDVCQIGYNMTDGEDGVIFLHPELIDQDVFCTNAIGGTPIIVSKKFKDFVDANSFTNVELIKAEDYKGGCFAPQPTY